MKNYIFALALFSIAFLFACKDPKPVNEEEVINKIVWEFTAPDNSTITASYIDPDGDGPQASQVVNANLAPYITYSAKLRFFNSLGTVEEEITPEVQSENSAHQVFYVHAVNGLNIVYDDQDKNGKPLGLKTKVTTSGPSAGPMQIVLRHNPDKNATGVKDGNIANAGGESDVDIKIPVDIR